MLPQYVFRQILQFVLQFIHVLEVFGLILVVIHGFAVRTAQKSGLILRSAIGTVEHFYGFSLVYSFAHIFLKQIRRADALRTILFKRFISE